MTRVTFSANNLDVALPRCWGELTDPELMDVYEVLASYPMEEAVVRVFRALSGMRVLAGRGDEFVLRFGVGRWLRKRSVLVRVSSAQMAELLKVLEFVKEPGCVPRRPEIVRGRRGVDVKLRGVPFGHYIQLENAMQAFLATQNPECLSVMGNILYPGRGGFGTPDGVESVALMHWVMQIKGMFSKMFGHFFRPAGAGGGDTPPNMVQVMNNEIRALTGGDLTKEQEVLDSDCWRALTELDFKAKEAAEFEKIKSK